MGTIASCNVHSGHCPQGKGAYGAVGILKESVENRKVKNALIPSLRSAGVTVYDCTDDTNCTERQNLVRICEKCNQHTVDADISLHLNSGRKDPKGDGDTGGVECLVTGNWKDMEDISAAICREIAKTLGIRNRGVKETSGLYVLNNTINHSTLVECCFVDDADDAKKWDANKCADAIFRAVTGKITTSGGTSTPITSGATELTADGSHGPKTTKRKQEFYGTTQDGVISGQPVANKEYCYALIEGGCVEWLANNEAYGSLMMIAEQKYLKSKGYYDGAIDGLMGPKHVKAKQEFLKDLGYYSGKIDGSYGPETCKADQRWLNDQD